MEAETRSREAATGRDASDRRRILVIEDHDETRSALTRLLGHDGWSVQAAATVDQASRLLDSNPDFNAALLDIHLPDGDGIALARRMRERLCPTCRIVVVSGDHSLETLRRLSSEEDPPAIDEFLGKPVSFDALVEAVSKPRP